MKRSQLGDYHKNQVQFDKSLKQYDNVHEAGARINPRDLRSGKPLGLSD